MSEACNCQRALTAAFEEAAFALAAVAAGYPIPDEAVWDLARALDRIHERARGRCLRPTSAPVDFGEADEHPAIAHLLRRLHEATAGTSGAEERRAQR